MITKARRDIARLLTVMKERQTRDKGVKSA
jgi:ribosomal protein L29